MVDKIEEINGYTRYYKNGLIHNDDGPALISESGLKIWYINGKRHRLDGPAIEYPNGTKRWYVNDKLHRLDGPAVEFEDGDKIWYVRGTDITEWMLAQGMSDNPTPDQQLLIALTWY